MTSVDTTRADWLASRKLGLGGSDIAAVLGMSPWTSPYALWAEKAGLLPDLDDPTEAMEFGLRAEDMLARWFEERTGMFVGGAQTVVVGAEPWMRCTVDGFVFETSFEDRRREHAIADAEWKVTSDAAATWEKYGVPDHYACQATWTSIVTGLPVVWFGVLHIAFGRPQFRTYQFTPDATDRALVLDVARRFWFDHVVTGIPPEIDGSDSTADALAAIYPGHIEGEAADLTDLAQVIEMRGRAKALAKELTDEAKGYDNQIAAALGTAEIGLIDGEPAYSYRAQTRTTTCEVCDHKKTSDPFRVLRPIKAKTNKKAA